ncbi:methyltransferase domain-containing protein [Stagonosporopsis vannaccii]|nr:methyltransferase domain-containing protein [Stagonosporopsis vannaccii]
MDEEAPHPDTLVGHDTAAPKRPRADSGSSTSIESVRSVRTVTSEDLEYVHENGRTYGNDTYFNPCVFGSDLKEQDRLFFQHQIFVHALQGRLTTTRLLPSTRRILDLGTGPGHWAVAMAQTHPQAEVVGIDMTQWDLDTTEATMGAANVIWELDDLDVWGVDSHMDELSTITNFDFYRNMMHREPIHSPPKSPNIADSAATKPPPSYPETSVESLAIDLYKLDPRPEPGWHFSDPYEFIHLRNMKGAFSHWEEVYAEIHKSLSPGGWVEVADWDMGAVPIDHATSDPSMFPIPTLRKLYASMMEASYKSGRPLGLFYMHPSYLEEAGFTDIQTTQVNMPIGQWVDDEEQKRIGKLLMVVVMEGFEASLLRLLTKFGDRERVWTAEEVRADIARAQAEVAEWVERSERGEAEGWCASFKWITGRKSWHAS